MSGLWRNRDFGLLWAGETVSTFGSQVSLLALPLTAVVSLGASPAQMGLLQSAGFLPYIGLMLFAGVLIDRVRRRPLLLLTNLGQGLCMAAVPALALRGWLRMEALYLIAFGIGCMQVIFSVAWQAYVPSLVERRQLVEANAKLNLSASGAGLAGPALGGLLVELVSAPIAVALDSLSFFAAGLSLLLIRRPEPAPRAIRTGSVWSDIAGGVRFLVRHPYLRPLAIEAATYNVFSNGVAALYVLYATRDLGLRPSLIGAIMTAGSVTWLLGAVLAEPLNQRLGVGRAMALSYTLACAAPVLVPLAGRLGWGALLGYSLVNGLGLAMSNIQIVSLRQAIIPQNIFGRVNATYRFINSSAIPVGPLLAGFLAEWAGLQAALVVCALGTLSALPWILFSPVLGLQSLPVGEPAPALAES